MFKKLFNRIKPSLIKDSYFGEMGSTFDKFDDCYYLDKDIDLENIHTPVILYVQSKNQRSNGRQQEAYESIKENFGVIWKKTIEYLCEKENVISTDQIRKEHRLESITLPIEISEDSMDWEMDLLNLKDGFSRIVVEMRKFEPCHWSTEA